MDVYFIWGHSISSYVRSFQCTCIYRSVNIDISVSIDYIQGDVYYNTIICTVMLHIYVYSSN